ncbi:hypothetical protein [Methylomagnum sp.]
MRSERVGIWYVPAKGSDDFALLIKAPTSNIKALIAGCPLNLSFGRRNNYLIAAARIYDIPGLPTNIFQVQRDTEEQAALLNILKSRRFPIFLFNEMDICHAWTNANISNFDAVKLIDFICPIASLYAGPFTDNASHALDCFYFTIDDTQAIHGATTLEVLEVAPVLETWRTIEINFVGLRGSQSVLIDNNDEGEVLERLIWASLISSFSPNLYKSPQVKIGKKWRQLTDVLAFYDLGVFLFESKDLSVFLSGYERSQDRRTKGVQKQIKKAIDQLIGASKALKRGEMIADDAGAAINVDRLKPFHCMVLVTELMFDGDWTDIQERLIAATKETNDFFHLLDVDELVTLLKCSSGKAEIFDYNLMERWKAFIERKSVHIRVRPKL